MKRLLLHTLNAACILGFMATAAKAHEVPCYKREDLVKQLVMEYEEIPVVAGRDENGFIMEVFASTKKTWTFVVTLPDGNSCILSSGTLLTMLFKGD